MELDVVEEHGILVITGIEDDDDGTTNLSRHGNGNARLQQMDGEERDDDSGDVIQDETVQTGHEGDDTPLGIIEKNIRNGVHGGQNYMERRT